jgi:hypothetical protein
MRNIISAIILVAGGFSIGTVVTIIRNQPQPKVVCESGAEYHDVRLFNDPYYKYSIACNLGDANGPLVVVEVID